MKFSLIQLILSFFFSFFHHYKCLIRIVFDSQQLASCPWGKCFTQGGALIFSSTVLFSFLSTLLNSHAIASGSLPPEPPFYRPTFFPLFSSHLCFSRLVSSLLHFPSLCCHSLRSSSSLFSQFLPWPFFISGIFRCSSFSSHLQLSRPLFLFSPLLSSMLFPTPLLSSHSLCFPLLLSAPHLYSLPLFSSFPLLCSALFQFSMVQFTLVQFSSFS